MKELKATPGPWWIEPETGDVVAKDGDWEICTFSRSDHQHEADTHLIAAAPELYEALNYLSDILSDERWADDARLVARSALAKARGES